jgi:SAM-dependent methyltransferase
MRIAVVLLAVSCGGAAVCRAEKPLEDEDRALFVGTPPSVVDQMLKLARVSKDDLVYDLGCGDGRIVVAAALQYGCRAVGFETAPSQLRKANENVRRSGVEELVRIENKDIFKLDLRDASVITLYLLPEMNERLLPQFEKMKDGARIVAHDYGIEGVRPDRVMTMTAIENRTPRELFLYTLPLRKASTSAAQTGQPK